MLVVADEDGAALVVAVVVDAPVLLAVSVDALVVDEAEVSAVLLVDVVVEPQAAIAARAPAAAKLKIKRMGSPLLPCNGNQAAIGAQSVRRLGAI